MVYFFSALPGKNSPLRDFMFKNFPHGCTSLILPHCGCRLAYPAPQTYLNQVLQSKQHHFNVIIGWKKKIHETNKSIFSLCSCHGNFIRHEKSIYFLSSVVKVIGRNLKPDFGIRVIFGLNNRVHNSLQEDSRNGRQLRARFDKRIHGDFVHHNTVACIVIVLLKIYFPSSIFVLLYSPEVQRNISSGSMPLSIGCWTSLVGTL